MHKLYKAGHPVGVEAVSLRRGMRVALLERDGDVIGILNEGAATYGLGGTKELAIDPATFNKLVREYCA